MQAGRAEDRWSAGRIGLAIFLGAFCEFRRKTAIGADLWNSNGPRGDYTHVIATHKNGSRWRTI